MRFLKANFRRYCVKKPRNASALLVFLPCLDKNLLFKNCFAPEGLVFSCSVVLLCRNYTDGIVRQKVPQCAEKQVPQAYCVGLSSACLEAVCRYREWAKKRLKEQNYFQILSINKDYISQEASVLISFVKYSLFLFVLLFGLR